MSGYPPIDTSKFWTDRTTNRSLMAIGAHADDIELTIGGTLSKYVDRDYKVVYVMTTNNMSGDWVTLNDDGTISQRTPACDEMMPQRKREAAAGAKFFGTEPIHLNFPQKHYRHADGRKIVVGYEAKRPDCVPPGVPTILTAQEDDAAIQRVTDLIIEHNSEAVITHGGPMNNIEHFATQLLVTRAYWKAVDAGYEGMLLNWHDLGVNEFAEAYKKFDTHVDITDYWDKKIECCALHACQKPDPTRLDWPQWGATCGCGHAEVFTIVGRNRKPKQYADFTLEILSNERG